ncbi:hypothetical protein HPP92_020412 [Vanilla planifolia]|uniref:Uncharacterized protein n=1 Tax=Vanilla planifolia TaxID=51239 RepID=A0A835UJR6_VANPL|nr:hypothetical protein HPP92_020412 [Vanilla planifolia]
MAPGSLLRRACYFRPDFQHPLGSLPFSEGEPSSWVGVVTVSKIAVATAFSEFAVSTVFSKLISESPFSEISISSSFSWIPAAFHPKFLLFTNIPSVWDTGASAWFSTTSFSESYLPTIAFWLPTFAEPQLEGDVAFCYCLKQ